MSARNFTFRVRMNAEETGRLERVAAHLGIAPSSALRFLVKRADDQLAHVGIGARPQESTPDDDAAGGKDFAVGEGTIQES